MVFLLSWTSWNFLSHLLPCRFSNAFSYYGLVLLTTELFQAGDVCSSEYCSIFPFTYVLLKLLEYLLSDHLLLVAWKRNVVEFEVYFKCFLISAHCREVLQWFWAQNVKQQDSLQGRPVICSSWLKKKWLNKYKFADLTGLISSEREKLLLWSSWVLKMGKPAEKKR